MRTLWQALVLLAENRDGFREKIRNAVDIEKRDEQPDEPFDLQTQPTFQSLQSIDRLFAEGEPPIYLSAYELAEISRWVRNDEGMQALDGFWAALKAKVPDVKPSSMSTSLLETIGALTIDSELRLRAWYEQTAPQKQSILEKHGFELSEHEQGILAALKPGGEADNMAKIWFAATWPGYPCLALAVPYPGWVHVNL